MIPETDRLAGSRWCIFQQDGTRADNANATLEYLDLKEPEYIPPEMSLQATQASNFVTPMFGVVWNK